MKKIKRHLKNHKASSYVELSICTIIIALIVSVCMQLVGVLNQKLWLDDKMHDMAKLVAVTGSCKSAKVLDVQNEITGRMGGRITVTGDMLDAYSGTVQLGGTVKINYQTTLTVFKLPGKDITSNINVDELAISEVYSRD